jgi:DNA polymerase-3 subunit beta
MEIQLSREQLMQPLQQVSGVVERRHTMAVLSHVMLEAAPGDLRLTATDLEVELMARLAVPVEHSGRITLPSRKLSDILRNLPGDSDVRLRVEGDRAILRAGRARFTLVTLPAEEFPLVGELEPELEFRIAQRDLRQVIERTHFAMAHQDVRYYLNGMLLETAGQTLTSVSTDGHRLALAEYNALQQPPGDRQIIVPRKGVQEMMRLLGDSDEELLIQVDSNHIRVIGERFRYTSKLIDGRYPDYSRVVPAEQDSVAVFDRLGLRDAISRVGILANEKYHGVRLQLDCEQATLLCHNTEGEEAQEELPVDYSGPHRVVSFSIGYLQDALGAMQSDTILMFVADNDTALLRESDRQDCRYVVMPMRL